MSLNILEVIQRNYNLKYFHPTINLSMGALSDPKFIEWPVRGKDAVIVAGVGRSGTTWLGNVVSDMLNARTIFEPFIVDKNGEFLIEKSGEINLENRVERPVALWDKDVFESKKKTVENMLFGSIKGHWIDQDAKTGIFSKRVIKLIRANYCIGHIAESWPKVKILFIVRSPDKVVESMLNQEAKGWKFVWKTEDIFSYAASYPEWKKLLMIYDWDKDSLVDRLTLRWCIEMFIAMQQLRGVENCMVVQYEDLVKGHEWNKLGIFLKDRGWLGEPQHYIIHKKSRTNATSTEIASSRLTSGQRERIRSMVKEFGLKEWIR
ncbi:sulfotransferase [Cycloclasticus pugetii]|uniref:sulfotransferase n=1 Tax=Cycloclasticus pugetii TaxID=34068 RepID=UPI00037A4695|nr:sulfotransferase [Cycloclasticus pugetii]